LREKKRKGDPLLPFLTCGGASKNLHPPHLPYGERGENRVIDLEFREEEKKRVLFIPSCFSKALFKKRGETGGWEGVSFAVMGGQTSEKEQVIVFSKGKGMSDSHRTEHRQPTSALGRELQRNHLPRLKRKPRFVCREKGGRSGGA